MFIFFWQNKQTNNQKQNRNLLIVIVPTATWKVASNKIRVSLEEVTDRPPNESFRICFAKKFHLHFLFDSTNVAAVLSSNINTINVYYLLIAHSVWICNISEEIDCIDINTQSKQLFYTVTTDTKPPVASRLIRQCYISAVPLRGAGALENWMGNEKKS